MKKNILFVGIGDRFKEEWAEYFIKEYNVDNAYATYYTKINNEDIFRERYYYWDIIYAKYGELAMKYLDNPPLDDSILKIMSTYDMEVMNLMGRMGDYSFEKRKNLYYKHISFWNNMLEYNEINYIVFDFVPHGVVDNTILFLAKIKGIKVCMSYEILCIANKTLNYLMSDYALQDTGIKVEFDKLKKAHQNENIENIKLPECVEAVYEKSVLDCDDNSKKPFYMKTRLSDVERYYGYSIREIKNSIFKKEDKLSERFFKKNFTFIHMIVRALRNHRRGYRQTKELIQYYDKLAIEPDFESKYIYCPLQYYPECTSAPLAGGIYADQVIQLKIIASNIPEHTVLYVKEHPTQGSFGRKKAFYDRILELPNTYLVKSDCSTYKLMHNAYAISTATGAAGWECQFYGKPFLMFGYSAIIDAPGTYHIRTNEDCRRAFDKIDMEYIAPSNFELKIFMQAVYNCSYESEVECKDIVERIGNILGLDKFIIEDNLGDCK